MEWMSRLVLEEGMSMPRVDETAYRQLKATPTLDERLLAQQHTTGKPALVAFPVLLKTFQHLGYAVPLTSAPMLIVSHIADQMQCSVTDADLINYDLSGTRRRHLQVIRAHLQISADGVAMREASACKDDLIDLINIAIEQLNSSSFSQIVSLHKRSGARYLPFCHIHRDMRTFWFSATQMGCKLKITLYR